MSNDTFITNNCPYMSAAATDGGAGGLGAASWGWTILYCTVLM